MRICFDCKCLPKTKLQAVWVRSPAMLHGGHFFCLGHVIRKCLFFRCTPAYCICNHRCSILSCRFTCSGASPSILMNVFQQRGRYSSHGDCGRRPKETSSPLSCWFSLCFSSPQVFGSKYKPSRRHLSGSFLLTISGYWLLIGFLVSQPFDIAPRHQVHTDAAYIKDPASILCWYWLFLMTFIFEYALPSRGELFLHHFQSHMLIGKPEQYDWFIALSFGLLVCGYSSESVTKSVTLL